MTGTPRRWRVDYPEGSPFRFDFSDHDGVLAADAVLLVIPTRNPPTALEVRRQAAVAHRLALDWANGLRGRHGRRDQRRRWLAICAKWLQEGRTRQDIADRLNDKILSLTGRIREQVAGLAADGRTDAAALAKTLEILYASSKIGVRLKAARQVSRSIIRVLPLPQETVYFMPDSAQPVPEPVRELLAACQELQDIHAFLEPEAPAEQFIDLYGQGLSVLEWAKKPAKDRDDHAPEIVTYADIGDATRSLRPPGKRKKRVTKKSRER